MTKRIDKVFSILWCFALCLSLIDSVTYSGFVQKHIFINPIFVASVAGVLGVITLVLNMRKKRVKTVKWFGFESILFVFVLILFVILKIANRLTYPNFVFSLIHVQPNNLLIPVLILLLPVVVIWLPRVDFKKLFSIKAAFIMLIPSLIIYNIFKIYKMENESVRFIILHPFASYEVKMKQKVGNVFYNYTQFIDKYTPENSSILMPPQAFPWPQSGNGAYLRYFIYPRNVGNGSEYSIGEKGSFSDYDFVLLAWGETPTTEGIYTHGWPKFDVPAESILFMNNDGTFGGEIKGNYQYKDYKGKEVWGLIKIKH